MRHVIQAELLQPTSFSRSYRDSADWNCPGVRRSLLLSSSYLKWEILTPIDYGDHKIQIGLGVFIWVGPHRSWPDTVETLTFLVQNKPQFWSKTLR